MLDSEHSTVTYTSISNDYEEPSDHPPSPDYVPSPEYLPSPDFVPEPAYPKFMPPEDDMFPNEEQPLPATVSPTVDSSGYITESDPEEDLKEDDEDPEEDPADYSSDRDDDDDDQEEEEENLAPANSVPPLTYRTAARMFIRAQTPLPFPSEVEVDRLLAIPTLPSSPLTLLSSPLPQLPSPPLPVSSPLPISPPPLPASPCSSRLLPNDDKRNLAQIADAPTGSEDAIVVPEITADKFELKHGLLTLKTNNFSDMTKKTLYLTFRYFTDHVCYEFPERPSTTVKLSISHFSLDGAARDMLKKTLSCDRFLHGMILFRNSSTNSSLLPKQQIFEMKSQDFNNDLMKLFTRHGPIKTSFGHAPHHGFSNYINLYFYNALNSNDQDIVNSTAGYPAIAIPHQKNVPAQIYRQTRALDSLTESELSTRGSRTFLALKDEPTSPKLEDTYNDPDVDIR
ncbi:hypothetical protein Tco_0471496 [Tanacetum coccineum]